MGFPGQGLRQLSGPVSEPGKFCGQGFRAKKKRNDRSPLPAALD
jgi:hypothetical protein